MKVDFTCAVCPNGCHLSMNQNEDGLFQPVETGRCVRGNFLIGKEYYFDGTSLIKLDAPMSKRQVAEMVGNRRVIKE